ncbi:DUF1206 domain-containing protein [Mycetocola manganoxydans]|uniref:DUF1206 domain-containing protein n=1 Tax=Mycetocola manganoxydans TaxID=699879 RepID=A0A3L6ZJ13_9MICO|nr:DUF1206 domain-containing protein [Mycetocola manganoxydans]RLP67863.1 DUF1206 domain-containing protein [Mycetocola manganoxydans]GHD51441.1 hypothetical protein GCM10008097_26380 [Mycetocola manganoxydans]
MTDESKRDEVKAAARKANRDPRVRGFARAGLVANGVIHILIGVIGISVAWGSAGNADQSGALTTVSDIPGGVFLLWAATIALFGLALLQWTEAAQVESTTPRLIVMRRMTNVAKAFGFAAIAVVVGFYALGNRSDASETWQRLSATLLGTPGGVFALAAVGLGVGIVGGTLVFRGVSRNFREEMEPMDGIRSSVVGALGIVGHVAKGIALAITGLLFLSSAAFTDSDQATGLDGALRLVGSLPFGSALLIMMASGFVVYGLYLFARARFLRKGPMVVTTWKERREQKENVQKESGQRSGPVSAKAAEPGHR